jgi:RHS repeat-associated protein
MKQLKSRILFIARTTGFALAYLLLCFAAQSQETLRDGGLLSTEMSVFTGTADAAPMKSLADNSTALLTCPTVPGEITANRKIQNIITLKLIEETPHYIPSDFDVTLRVKVQYGKNIGDAIDQDFSLTYRKGEGVKYNGKQYLVFEDATPVRVTIVGIIGTEPVFSGFNIRDILRLENEMRITRYFVLSPEGARRIPSSLSHALTTDQDQLDVSWTWLSRAGNNYTQLEWTWLEDEMESYYHKNGVLDYDLLFNSNATRVDLPVATGSYKIPLLYDGVGKLYYRVRASNISREARSDAEWSSVQSFSFGGHDALRNWQARTSFAEGGKRNSIVDYFDGSLRSRQTVAKDLAGTETIVAETMYDGQGRAALQVLPVPRIGATLSYTANLNLFNTQTPNTDPADFFDLETSAEQLKTSSGAGKYYSPNNSTTLTGFDKYIPDAEGYPYTLTRYTQDASGRILSQSGVGKNHQIGSGHETKFYYGSAAQEELDGLFGTDVGTKTHYFKNMVRDANGQMSVSYVDMHGRTIATALAGEAPGMLVGLPKEDQNQYPNQAGTQVKRDLLDLNSNIVKGNSIESINTILVPVSRSYAFSYSLTPQSLESAACEGAEQATVCHDCLYDLEVSITDESGDTPPIIRKFSNVSVSPDTDCTTPVPGLKAEGSNVASNTINFTQLLDVGSYSIRKTLTVSEVSLQRYKDLWMQQRVCKTEQELIDSIYAALIQVSDCGESPESVAAATCQECTANLGDYTTTFKPAYLVSIGHQGLITAELEKEMQTAYKSALDNCNLLCQPVSQVSATKRQLMLADMMPGGQYAQLPLIEDGNNMHDKYDIFSTHHPTRTAPAYRRPIDASQQEDYYYDATGKTDVTIHPSPLDRYVKLEETSAQEFVDIFQPSWATSLLRYHPEFDRLIYAETTLQSAYNWINNFNNTELYSVASSNGYFDAANNDPLYSVANSSSYKTTIQGWVGTNYANNLSLWQIARGDLKCKSIADASARDACYVAGAKVPPFTSDYLSTEEENQVWLNFRNLYSSLRDQQSNAMIAAAVPVADQTPLTNAGYRMRFADNAQLAAQNGLNWVPSTPGGTPPNVPANIPQDSLTQFTLSSCSAYISEWRKTLEECPQLAASPAMMDTIIARMLVVCQKGADASNPFGASTVSPLTPNDGSPKSFEEVINQVLSENNIPLSAACSPYTIESPRQYGALTPAIFGNNVVDTCNCALLRQYYNDAGMIYGLGKVAHLNDYLKSQSLDTFKTQGELQFFLDACAGNSKPVQATFVIPKSLASCSAPCTTCGDLSSLILEFRTKFPGLGNVPIMDPAIADSGQLRNNLLADFLNSRTGNNYTWNEYAAAAAAANCNLLTLEENTSGGGSYPVELNISSRTGNTPSTYVASSVINFLPGFSSGDGDSFIAYIAQGGSAGGPVVLCPRQGTIIDTSGIYLPPVCQRVYEMASAIGTQLFQQRSEYLLTDFEKNYRAKCLDASEQFTVTYTSPEYHYTLYYYDMAGSLVKTVPPKGVRPDFSAGYLASVKAARAIDGKVQPAHELVTQYRYNSLGEVVSQVSPDAGISNFWYDNLGRLVVSQNAQQQQDGKYSYTRYDALGRIIEVGQKPSTETMDQTVSQLPSALNTWIMTTGSTREQLTLTVYDRAYGSDISDPESVLTPRMRQHNLRNRVSFSSTKYLATDQFHNTASFYTYDIHGNVDTLLQDYKGMLAMRNDRFKMIAYDYDLISGNIKGLDYQPNWYAPLIGVIEYSDKYFHKYIYDDRNRLIETKSSRDNILWEREAAYEYYLHGELARKILGEQKVQGLDYAYTLQGWLKGVNSVSVGTGEHDMGKDGVVGGNNWMVARDVFGFGIHYYDQGGSGKIDYKPIDLATSAFPRPAAQTEVLHSLYNGNIAALSVNIVALQKAGVGVNSAPLLYRYRYDQLNRLKTMETFEGLISNAWSLTQIPDYNESVNYDPNGNILSYQRKGAPKVGLPEAMDNLTYHYDENTNRLNHVEDAVISSSYVEDLEGQSANHYTYDKIGNLITEGNTNITWRVDGKISSIVKSGNTITYEYDADGERISKTSSAANLTTVYVRDAIGRVMGVYEKKLSAPLVKTESYLYGDSRLGLAGNLTVEPVDVVLGTSGLTAKFYTQTRGEKYFELNNHLGNVLAVVSDKKIQVNSGGDVSYYTAEVKSATDYYPFGMQMVGRKWESGGYRYGFNGKENDNDVKGDGNQQDYGMRIYDPRIAKFLSIDPLTSDYPELTPYQFASNIPIAAIDLDGMEAGVQLPDGTIIVPSGRDRLGFKYPQKGVLLGVDRAMAEGEFEELASMTLDFIPFVGQLKAITESVTGKDFITGRKLSAKERILNLIPGKKAEKVDNVLRAGTTLQKVEKQAQKVAVKLVKVKNKVQKKDDSESEVVGTALEKPRKDAAQAYEDNIPGAASDVKTKKRIVPTLPYDNPNPRGRKVVKFDGFDVESKTLVDRKWNIVFFPKAQDQLRRMSAALSQNPGYSGVIEVPNQAVYEAALRAVQKAGVSNISVRIAP